MALYDGNPDEFEDLVRDNDFSSGFGAVTRRRA